MFKWWSGLKSRIAKLELKFAANARQLEWTNASDKVINILPLFTLDIQFNWTNGSELIEWIF